MVPVVVIVGRSVPLELAIAERVAPDAEPVALASREAVALLDELP